MTPIDPHEAVRDRALVVAKTGPGEIHGAGRVIAYSMVPTFTIERPDGTRFGWRHDMVEPLAHGDVTFEVTNRTAHHDDLGETTA